MKTPFKCRKRGQLNEFETGSARERVLLREAAGVGPGEAAEVSPCRTYLVECESCGFQNSVTIREEEV